MSVTPGPRRVAVASIANGRSAAVPGSKTVSMWPMRRTRGPPAPGAPSQRPDDRRPERARPDRAGARPRRRCSVRNAGDEPADLVDAVGRVAAAVDVDEPLEVGEVGRLGGADGGLEGGQLGVVDAGPGRGRSSPRWAVYGPRPLAILGGPCAWSRSACSRDPNVYRLEPVVKVEVAIGRRRTWYGQREPGPPRRSSASGATVPRTRLAAPGRAARRLGPPAAGRPRRGPRRRRRPSLVRPRPLDRDVPVDRRGAGPHDRRGGGRPRRSATSSPARRARLTGAPGARCVARWHATDRRRPDDAAGLDPRRRPADPGRLDHRHERQEHRRPG